MGAALPGVVQTEGQGAGVPALQGRKLPESAVLNVDGAVVELNPSDGKVPAELGKSDVRVLATLCCHVVCTSEVGGQPFLMPPPPSNSPSAKHC